MKIVFGYLLRLLGILSVISFIGQIFGLFSNKGFETKIEMWENIGALLFAAFIAYLSFKYSKRLLKK